MKIELSNEQKSGLRSWATFTAGLCGIVIAVRVTHRVLDILLAE